ncbi:MAG: PASTA domain-containing protein [Deltaproteobacteria bacterium]|nr:PASTA domain-containing protein [Deltaproteobacteria bacterium]
MMPKIKSPTEMTEALSAPLGDLISAVGKGVAEAQHAMDMQTIETFKSIYGPKGSNAKAYEELKQLGYQPTWYKIPEASAEITISLTVSGEAMETGTTGSQQGTSVAEPQGPGRIKLYAAPVDANYTNRYNFDLKAASHLKFKIVPVPPSSQTTDMKIMPDLAGKTLREARDILEELDISYNVVDMTPATQETDVLAGFAPEAGKILTTGQEVLLKFS